MDMNNMEGDMNMDMNMGMNMQMPPVSICSFHFVIFMLVCIYL